MQPSGSSLEAAAYTVTPGPRKRGGVYSRFWRQSIVESAALCECFFLSKIALSSSPSLLPPPAPSLRPLVGREGKGKEKEVAEGRVPEGRMLRAPRGRFCPILLDSAQEIPESQTPRHNPSCGCEGLPALVLVARRGLSCLCSPSPHLCTQFFTALPPSSLRSQLAPSLTPRRSDPLV